MNARVAEVPTSTVPRPRLIGPLAEARVLLVEGGGGWGKTVLAGQWAQSLEMVPVAVRLETPESSAAEWAGELRRSLSVARLSDLAAVVRGLEPVRALDRLLEALEHSDAVLFVFDDVHHLSEDAAPLVAKLAAEAPTPHRTAVLGRRLPGLVKALRLRPAVTMLTGDDLAFTAQEVAALVAAAGAASVGTRASARMRAATGGWAAPLAIAAHRIAASADSTAAVDRILAGGSGLRELVDGCVQALTDERAVVNQIARLPLLAPDLIDELAERPGLFARMLSAGLPLTPAHGGWWTLPDPVREELASGSAPALPILRRASRSYLAAGEVARAVRLLVGAGDDMAAAELLAALEAHQVSQLDLVELEGIVSSLDDVAVASHPRVLLQLARALEAGVQRERRSQVLHRAGDLLADGRDPRLLHEVDAESARTLCWYGRFDEAEALGAHLLRLADAEEVRVRAIATEAVGRARAERADLASLASAEPLLSEAAEQWRNLGDTAKAAHIYSIVAQLVDHPAGRFDRCLARYGEALDLLRPGSRSRGITLTLRAEVFADLGRFSDATADMAEAREIGTSLVDRTVLAYVAWDEARIASMSGDRERTLEAVERVESLADDWFAGPSGPQFLADAADMLARVGDARAAAGYLDLARGRYRPPEAWYPIAKGAIEARTGNPAEAERTLRSLSNHKGPGPGPRDLWRFRLLRAYAARRMGDPRAATLAADAFDGAARCGHPELPLIRERELALELLPLAAATGSEVAAALGEASVPTDLKVLGGFEVSRGGRPVEVMAGKPRQALKVLAVKGGEVHVDELMESLWPSVDPETGRQRLRNVLNRIRASAGEIVVREEESLALLPSVRVDVKTFLVLAERALVAARAEGPALGAVRSALARYGGPLLPADCYEEFTISLRERVQRRYLALLDLATDEALKVGEVDEAVRLLERAVEADPYDEARYIAVARLRLEQGRRGASLAWARRARAALEELGLTPGTDLLALEAMLQQG